MPEQTQARGDFTSLALQQETPPSAWQNAHKKSLNPRSSRGLLSKDLKLLDGLGPVARIAKVGICYVLKSMF